MASRFGMLIKTECILDMQFMWQVGLVYTTASEKYQFHARTAETMDIDYPE